MGSSNIISPYLTSYKMKNVKDILLNKNVKHILSHELIELIKKVLLIKNEV